MRKFRFRQDVARASTSRQGGERVTSGDDSRWKNEGAFSEAFAARSLEGRLRCGEVATSTRRSISPSALSVGCMSCACVLSREAVKEMMAVARARGGDELAVCPVCDGLSLITVARLRELGGGAPVAALLRFLYQRCRSAFRSW